MTEVCDMFLETELSDKLNNELESAGISVSEALIARTLAAVQAAKDNEAKTELENEIQQGIQTLSELRKAKQVSVRSALFRAATVMAACFVLVVGAFALRFSTMRMGKEEAAPMAAAENGSARNGVQYAADADSVTVEEDYKYFSEPTQSQVMNDADAAEYPAEGKTEPLEPLSPAVEAEMADEAEAVMNDAAEGYEALEFDAIDAAMRLWVELSQAESVEKERTAQGTTMYRFVVREDAEATACYLVYENGEVKYTKSTADGESVTGMLHNGEDSEELKEFRKAVLEWMKKHGYEFDAE